MANHNTLIATASNRAHPTIHTIGMADLKDALSKGIDDFKTKPSHVIFLSIIYPVVGLFLARMTFGYDVLPLLFPLVAGFALIGPCAAIGLYELSRRRELGIEDSWRHAFEVLRSSSIRSIETLGLILMAIFVAWLGSARTIYVLTLGGGVPASISDFMREVFTTPSGWALIVLGNGVGFVFAAAVLTISVVSFPLLLDRNVGVSVAIETSMRAVLANPITMSAWGLIVAGLLVIGSLPFFVGLAVVMPVLGHSTWHLYRKVVGR